jgi:hypothetical protein
VEVTVNADAATTILRFAVDVCFVGLLESVTCTVKLNVPAAPGVPEITPALLSDSPAGSEPALSAHVYGGMPPLAASVAE